MKKIFDIYNFCVLELFEDIKGSGLDEHAIVITRIFSSFKSLFLIVVEKFKTEIDKTSEVARVLKNQKTRGNNCRGDCGKKKLKGLEDLELWALLDPSEFFEKVQFFLKEEIMDTEYHLKESSYGKAVLEEYIKNKSVTLRNHKAKATNYVESFISNISSNQIDLLNHVESFITSIRGNNVKLNEKSFDEFLASLKVKLRSVNSQSVFKLYKEIKNIYASNLINSESQTSVKDLDVGLALGYEFKIRKLEEEIEQFRQREIEANYEIKKLNSDISDLNFLLEEKSKVLDEREVKIYGKKMKIKKLKEKLQELDSKVDVLTLSGKRIKESQNFQRESLYLESKFSKVNERVNERKSSIVSRKSSVRRISGVTITEKLKDYEIEGLKNRISILENNQKGINVGGSQFAKSTLSIKRPSASRSSINSKDDRDLVQTLNNESDIMSSSEKVKNRMSISSRKSILERNQKRDSNFGFLSSNKINSTKSRVSLSLNPNDKLFKKSSKSIFANTKNDSKRKSLDNPKIQISPTNPSTKNERFIDSSTNNEKALLSQYYSKESVTSHNRSKSMLLTNIELPKVKEKKIDMENEESNSCSKNEFSSYSQREEIDSLPSSENDEESNTDFKKLVDLDKEIITRDVAIQTDNRGNGDPKFHGKNYSIGNLTNAHFDSTDQSKFQSGSITERITKQKFHQIQISSDNPDNETSKDFQNSSFSKMNQYFKFPKMNTKKAKFPKSDSNFISAMANYPFRTIDDWSKSQSYYFSTSNRKK